MVLKDGQQKPTCRISRCSNVVMAKGRNAKGDVNYRTVCQAHHRAKTFWKKAGTICSKCGWRGRCDKHRPKATGGYADTSNWLPVCPNCHRAAHGYGEWNQPQVYSGV